MGLLTFSGRRKIPLRSGSDEAQQKFVRSETEWASKSLTKQQVIRVRNSSLNIVDEIVYTVPDHKTFFLTGFHATLSLEDGIGNPRVQLVIRNPAGAFIFKIIELETESLAGSTVSNSLNFSMPLKFEEGHQFVIDMDFDLGSSRGQIFFCGWEEDSQD